ncbi:MAG: hypothetical protein H6843_07135 [Rhodospirillaceae bacterium]|nr:hypothetical protein [Rhodospirillaceae bacterium]
MTFSFRPLRLSTLPDTAASVRTRVVSWNEAAEMNDLGLQAGLGDALQHRLALGRAQPSSASVFSFSASKSSRSTCSPTRKVVSPGVGDLDLLQHLANDHLDVLVVDLHALQPIDVLDLVDQIVGQRLHAHHRQDVVRHRVAVHQQVALDHQVALLDGDVLALGDQVFAGLQAASSRGATTMRRLVL